MEAANNMVFFQFPWMYRTKRWSL